RSWRGFARCRPRSRRGGSTRESLAFGSLPWGKPCFPHVAPFFQDGGGTSRFPHTPLHTSRAGDRLVSDTSTEQLVRDAMLPDPHPLDGGMSAQEAAEALTRPAVRAVLVCDDGRLVGVITRKTLVREVVAAGRDPRTTTLREIAEPPNATLESGMPLAQAFA